MKKRIRQIAMAVICTLVLSVAMPAAAGTQTGLTITAQAATIKLSAKKKTLAVGQTAKLKVKGTGKKVKWKSTNSKVVSVNSKGKIRAKKKGTATIKAIVGKKVLKCKVTVKKNTLTLSGGSVARQTGFWDISQNGEYQASINIMPVSLAYTAKGSLKVKYMLWNFSTFDWTRISVINGVHIETYNGTVLVDLDTVTLTNPVSLAPDETLYLTLTFSPSQVRKVVNLNKAGGIRYSIDIYRYSEWYN